MAPSRPELPEIHLELLEDLSPQAAPGFLKLIRRRYRAHYPDGSVSEPFVYDQIDRVAIDAVVICAHFVDGGRRHVYLRSALRPPIHDRDPSRGPFELVPQRGNLWELPAGLVEARDQTCAGPRLTAQRELFEELGFQVEVAGLKALGPVVFPAPGFVAEQHFFFEIDVNPALREQPALDGSALEQWGRVVAVPLSEALELCRLGQIQDAKSELGLRRLQERVT